MSINDKYYARIDGKHYHIRECAMLADNDFKNLNYQEVTIKEIHERKLCRCQCVNIKNNDKSVFVDKSFRLKIPNSDKVGIAIIKRLIKHPAIISNNKIYQCLGLAESEPDSKEKTELLEIIHKEMDKRGLIYD